MQRKEEIEKIERYIKGESGEDEIKYIESLFILNGEENYILKEQLRKDWQYIFNEKPQEARDLIMSLDRIHHLIRKSENSDRNKPVQRFMRLYAKAAAILILPLLIGGGIYVQYLMKTINPVTENQVYSTIYSPMGSRVSFILPDSTTGMLNSGSHLTYSLPFINNRHIELEGEAWFDVKRDEKHPFEVKTGNSSVKVTGTTFNLSAYPAENYVEVVLVEGKVEFDYSKEGKKVIINPSERLVYKNKNFVKLKVDPAKYYGWIEGKLIFRGDQMSEVVRRIERWYNVKIIIADKELERYSFRATFEDDPIEEVLKCLALTSPIGYKIIPRALLPDSTFNKEEIVIYKLKI